MKYALLVVAFLLSGCREVVSSGGIGMMSFKIFDLKPIERSFLFAIRPKKAQTVDEIVKAVDYIEKNDREACLYILKRLLDQGVITFEDPDKFTRCV